MRLRKLEEFITPPLLIFEASEIAAQFKAVTAFAN